MIAQPLQRTAPMTVEEFLARPDTNQPMEYEDGAVMLLPMPTTKHQRIVLNTADVFKSIMPSGKRYVAPVDVRRGGRVYQPDVLWIKAGGACVDKGTYLDGAPDVVVEILSPSTSKRDRRDKYATYEQHGVSEYWLVEPDSDLIEIYTLVDGRYMRHGAFGTEDTFTSPAFGAGTPISGALIFAE